MIGPQNMNEKFKRIFNRGFKIKLLVLFALEFSLQSKLADEHTNINLKAIQDIIDNVNSLYIDNLPKFITYDEIIICDSNEPLLKNYKDKQEDKICFIFVNCGKMLIEWYTKDQLHAGIKKHGKNRRIYMLNHKMPDIFNIAINYDSHLSINQTYLANLYFEAKMNSINTLLILLTPDFSVQNSESLKKMGIHTESTQYTITTHIKSFTYDTYYFSYTKITNKNFNADQILSYAIFTDLENNFKDNINELRIIDDKIKFTDGLIKGALLILLKHKILVKAIEIGKYPEIVSLFFPGQFYYTNLKYFASYELLNFCLFCNHFKDFIDYNEYFDHEKVQILVSTMPEIYLSDFFSGLIRLNF